MNKPLPRSRYGKKFAESYDKIFKKQNAQPDNNPVGQNVSSDVECFDYKVRRIKFTAPIEPEDIGKLEFLQSHCPECGSKVWVNEPCDNPIELICEGGCEVTFFER